MNQYRGQPGSIRALVEDDRVHRDVYLSEELFALEQENFFATLRVERLKGARAHSQSPPSRGQHVLQQPFVELRDDAASRYELSAPFMYMEARAEQQLVLGGVCRHTLEQVGGALRIRLKRVDLLNAEAAFPAIQLFP